MAEGIMEAHNLRVTEQHKQDWRGLCLSDLYAMPVRLASLDRTVCDSAILPAPSAVHLDPELNHRQPCSCPLQ
jgi:hypothetical protein